MDSELSENRIPKIESRDIISNVSMCNLCRICLENVNHLSNLFTNNPDTVPYSQKLNSCIPSISILENDPYPKGICGNCSHSLDRAYEFYVLATKSATRLYELVNVRMKEEQEDGEAEKHLNLEPDETDTTSECTVMEKPKKLRKNAAIKDVNGRYVRRKKQIRVAKVKCELCGKMFIARSHLLRHMRIHTGERPFICETCGRSFKLLETLVSHTKTHDSNRLKKRHCSKCNFQTDSLNNFTVHMRVHTGETPFSCERCPKKFNVKGNLDLHTKRCHCEKTITCKFCPVKCRTRGELLRHLHQHNLPVLYRCPECSKTYSAHDNLVMHIKNVHHLNTWPNKVQSQIINPNYVQVELY